MNDPCWDDQTLRTRPGHDIWRPMSEIITVEMGKTGGKKVKDEQSKIQTNGENPRDLELMNP